MKNGYSINKLSELVNRDRRTIKKVLELAKADSSGGYTIEQYVEAMVEHEITKRLQSSDGEETINGDYERARKDREQADKLAIENQVRRGELMVVTEVRKGWETIVSLMRARMLSLPSRSAGKVASESKVAVCNDILMQEIRQILEEISNGSRYGVEDDAEEE